jgi:hypothetical protein
MHALCAADAPQREKKKKRRRAPRIVFPNPDRHRKPAKAHVYPSPENPDENWAGIVPLWMVQRDCMHDRLNDERQAYLAHLARKAARAAKRAAKRAASAALQSAVTVSAHATLHDD